MGKIKLENYFVVEIMGVILLGSSAFAILMVGVQTLSAVGFIVPGILISTGIFYYLYLRRRIIQFLMERKRFILARRKALEKKKESVWKNAYLEKIESMERRDRRYVCDKCGYRWESKKRFGSPSVCPSCRERFITKYTSTNEWKREIPNFEEFKLNLH